VVAIKRGHKSDPTQVKIDVVEHAGGVTICAVYPTDGAPNQFRVKVPAGVGFVGRTVNGGVEVEAAGTARATTVNGGIEARCGRADWTGALALKTVNGSIALTKLTATTT